MKILLIGYGKMGKTIEKMALSKGHTITGRIDIDNFNEIDQLLSESDVAIEFTNPESAYRNLLKCVTSQTPVVCGTTGWLEKYNDLTKAVSENESAFFYASNYSIGVNIFFAINEHLAKMMNRYPQYDIEIDETHHTEKKDAPSGTAITIAEGITDHVERKNDWQLDAQGQYESDRIKIRAHREGIVYGKHTVTYDSPIDQIVITHDAHTRDGFAMGALMAAEWIHGKKGVYGMKDMLGL
jgi:4-hydroxy-tetrahydrodipicolinate reductase